MAKEVKENIVEEVKETAEVAVTEEEICEKPKLITRVVAGVKKHGKKIAVGAALATATLIGYALVKKAGGSSDDFDGDYADDTIDVTDTVSEETID